MSNDSTDFVMPEIRPKFFDFSWNGVDWVTAQVNSRAPLTMEYRKEQCAELPYYCVERKEYWRYCRVHVVKAGDGVEGYRECTPEEIDAVLHEVCPNFTGLDRLYCEWTVDQLETLAKEILRLRDVVKNLEEVIADE